MWSFEPTNQTDYENDCIASETFGANGCNYFIDFKRARNNRNYLQITRSDRQADQSYKRSSVTIFEDHFYFLVESLSMLFTSAARQKDVLSVSLQDKENIKVVLSNGIKSWAPHLRPREKLMTQGRSAMSDAELLAILIGSGTTDKTAVELASEILASVDGQLSGLSRLSVRALCRFKGSGRPRRYHLFLRWSSVTAGFANKHILVLTSLGGNLLVFSVSSLA